MEKNLYFQDETTKIIFVLVELNGELQMKFLNIDRIHYANKKIAKNRKQNLFIIYKNLRLEFPPTHSGCYYEQKQIQITLKNIPFAYPTVHYP